MHLVPVSGSLVSILGQQATNFCHPATNVVRFYVSANVVGELVVSDSSYFPSALLFPDEKSVK